MHVARFNGVELPIGNKYATFAALGDSLYYGKNSKVNLAQLRR
jgi:hypothetical protein